MDDLERKDSCTVRLNLGPKEIFVCLSVGEMLAVKTLCFDCCPRFDVISSSGYQAR